ncbi:MAG: Gfo/Idh/MocA family oxidoreductase [Rhodobacteraceae bacterium]|nr:Gfo/Idh/MocA family oxidoreductase [Paracoccaceae bacterium]
MTHLRWGILGAAKFAREHMGPAIHSARSAALVAVASRDASKVVPFQEMAPGCRAVSSYDDLLADDEIDAVYIPLPNHLHVPWALKALEAGKHVLVEKPATLRAAEFDDLTTARDASGKLCAEAYMIVHHPQWQRVKHLVADGAVGQLKHIRGAFSFDNSADTKNIRNTAGMGGGALRDIGVYIFGSARFVTGQEPEVTGALLRMEQDFDTFADVDAAFPNGVTYSAYVSTRLHPTQSMEFHGTEGLIRLTAPFNPNVFDGARIEIHQPGLGLRVERFPAANHYVNQVEAFVAATRGEAYPCPLEFSRGTQVMIDRVLELGEVLDG